MSLLNQVMRQRGTTVCCVDAAWVWGWGRGKTTHGERVKKVTVWKALYQQEGAVLHSQWAVLQLHPEGAFPATQAGTAFGRLAYPPGRALASQLGRGREGVSGAAASTPTW